MRDEEAQERVLEVIGQEGRLLSRQEVLELVAPEGIDDAQASRAIVILSLDSRVRITADLGITLPNGNVLLT